jgi:hypothetical protein
MVGGTKKICMAGCIFCVERHTPQPGAPLVPALQREIQQVEALQALSGAL